MNNRPRYNLRLVDLAEWHVVWARCFRCHHEGSVDRGRLLAHREPSTRIAELERYFCCSHCGNRGHNHFFVRLRPR